MPAFLFPVALDLTDRPCVVVGGGAVGSRRAAALVAAGARVTVVDPEPRDVAPGIRVLAEPFVPGHLDDAFLTVAATSDPAVNTRVAQAARERGVLLNQAAPGDSEEGGDFAVMASVVRGPLALGVVGGGPALSARIRDELAGTYDSAWGEFARLLSEARDRARRTIADPRRRAAALRAATHDPLPLARLRAGDTGGARDAIRAHLETAEGSAPCPS